MLKSALARTGHPLDPGHQAQARLDPATERPPPGEPRARPVGRAGLARRPLPPSISCVVPCRNEAENLLELLPLLEATLAHCAADWEIVLVDDGSTDDTALVVERWIDQGRLRLIQLSRNFGKEAALSAGLQAAAGAVVVTMDADLQHPPALIPVFIDHWRAGVDVAYAVRSHRRDESWLKRTGARGFYALLNAADRVEVPADAGDFRLMDRCVVDALLALHERNRFMKGLYAWVGFASVAVPYVPDERAHGRTNFSPRQLARHSIDGLTAFTTLPLRAVSAAGLAIALVAFLYGGYLTINYLLHGHMVSGWTTIVVGLMLFSGIQLLSLGIVGEYVGRVFEEVKSRPLYVVRRDSGRGLSEPRA